MRKKDSHFREELLRLRGENNRLKSLLNQHGIIWEKKIEIPTPDTSANLPANDLSLSIKDKIALFIRLFRGRDDVYPQCWKSAIDSLLAATALEYGLRMVTRNTTDFKFPGLEAINPWGFSPWLKKKTSILVHLQPRLACF